MPSIANPQVHDERNTLTPTFSYTRATGSNLALQVCHQSDREAYDVTNVTWGGVSFTKQTLVKYPDGATSGNCGMQSQWTLAEADFPAGLTHDIVVTVSGNGGNIRQHTAICTVLDCNPTIEATATASLGTVNPSILAVTTLTDNALIIDGISNQRNIGTYTAGAGQTLFNEKYVAQLNTAQSWKVQATAGLTDMEQQYSSFGQNMTRGTHTLIVFPAAGGPGPQNLDGSRFDDADTFYSHTIQPGAVSLTGTLYTDADTIYNHTLEEAGAQTLTGTLYDDADGFGNHTIEPGPVDLDGSLYSDPDTIYNHSLSSGNDLTGSLYANVNTIYDSTIVFAQDLTGSLYSDADIFYDHVMRYDQDLTGSRYDDPDTIYNHVIRDADQEGGLHGKKSLKNLREWMSLPR